MVSPYQGRHQEGATPQNLLALSLFVIVSVPLINNTNILEICQKSIKHFVQPLKPTVLSSNAGK